MTHLYYLLQGRTPVACTAEQWAQQVEESDGGPCPHVAETEVAGTLVSTIFLGVNHNWGKGPPILFETMTFGKDGNSLQRRYGTFEEALAGHNAIVEQLKQTNDVKPRSIEP